jgi:hypothetical protein
MSNPEDPSDAAFFGVLFGEDELGVVVRAHIHIEAKLLELLELLVPAPTYLERMDLDFGAKSKPSGRSRAEGRARPATIGTRKTS